MVDPNFDLALQIGVQFVFMLLFFLERRSHDDTRKELMRVLLFMAHVPAADDLQLPKTALAVPEKTIPV